MSFARTVCWLTLRLALASLCLVSMSGAQVLPEPGGSQQIELSSAVTLDEIEAGAQRHLERFRTLRAHGDWSEAIDALGQAVEDQPNRVVALTPRLYVNVRDYCHLLIAGLPDEALSMYRDRVEPQARRWYEQGLEARDPSLLRMVVDQAFCSRWGDDALNALAELSLEGGNFGQARAYWEMLIETPPERIEAGLFHSVRRDPTLRASDAALLDEWYRAAEAGPPENFRLMRDAGLPEAAAVALVNVWRSQGLTRSRLTFPGTDLPRADIFARLILVSILEGSHDRARQELAGFAREYGTARGRLGGRQVSLSEELAALLAASERWPLPASPADWPTFAGSTTRMGKAPRSVDVGPVIWRRTLAAAPSDAETSRSTSGESERFSWPAHYPVVAGNLALANDDRKIQAWRLADGQAAWGEAIDTSSGVPDAWKTPQAALGDACHTLTAYGDKLFARMGNPITAQPRETLRPGPPGYLVCLDLAAEGKLVWRSPPLEDRWAFEGTPVCDGPSIYVCLRRSAVQSQAHVACLDAATGRQRWRRFIAAAESPGRGRVAEMSHSLLTLDGAGLYVNTNLGAVAYLDAQDGRIRWIHRYPRDQLGKPRQRPGHRDRVLTPCVYDRGRLFVAAADMQGILALDAATGLVLWENDLPQDVAHLLGVGGNRLWASGRKLWALAIDSGKVDLDWPQDSSAVQGFGRGLLAGGLVYWPAETQIYVFDQKTALPARAPIELTTRGASGGNLVISQGRLLIATRNELVALGASSRLTGFTDDPQRKNTLDSAFLHGP